ncbi:MAG: AbrB/MazE/SpoVT family DNA-binding domain-containing protein [Verrucomicrobiales bacterium]|nr:AbrB/MazE/SpoVT family DNA-binding domain-containing protein [Verrucomicrobiales bacterium]
MTTVLEQKGQLVLPQAVRDELHLHAGDGLEVFVDDGEIVLRPITKCPEQGLASLLLNPPCLLELPEREPDSPPPAIDFEE